MTIRRRSVPRNPCTPAHRGSPARKPLHVLLFPVGSAGDVYPFIALGRELRRRGHRVTAFTSGYFSREFDHCDVPLVDVFGADEFLAAIREPGLWRAGLTGLRHIVRLSMQHVQRQYEIVAAHHADPGTLVVTGPLAFGTRVAQDKLGVPTVSIALAPCMFASAVRPPRLPGTFMPSWLPTWAKRGQLDLAYWVADRLFLELNRFRDGLGLPPVRRVLGDWINSPTLTVGLFPPWFAEPPGDWPPQVRLTGFPLFDQVGGSDCHELVWDAAPDRDNGCHGGAPIVFTFGSAMLHARQYFAAAIEACHRLRRPAVMLTRFGDQLPSELPPYVRHLPHAPLSRLLPRAAAVVHHGGIGTLSQGLAAGVPQLIVPMAHDQFDNAAHLQRLGAGGEVARKKFRAAGVARALSDLLNDAELRVRCQALAARCDGVDAVGAACDLIERAGSRGGSTHCTSAAGFG